MVIHVLINSVIYMQQISDSLTFLGKKTPVECDYLFPSITIEMHCC